MYIVYVVSVFMSSWQLRSLNFLQSLLTVKSLISLVFWAGVSLNDQHVSSVDLIYQLDQHQACNICHLVVVLSNMSLSPANFFHAVTVCTQPSPHLHQVIAVPPAPKFPALTEWSVTSQPHVSGFYRTFIVVAFRKTVVNNSLSVEFRQQRFLIIYYLQ